MSEQDPRPQGPAGGVPRGHIQPQRPSEENPFMKLDSPTQRRFGEDELEPLGAMMQHSLANEAVNKLVNQALAALPEYWIRLAGVHLPELGSPVRYLLIGPTGSFIITPTNGAWTNDGLLELEHAARAVDRRLPNHDWSATRLRLVFAPDHPSLQPQVLGIPGMRRVWVMRADELHAHLRTHPGAGPCQGDLTALQAKLAAKFPPPLGGTRPFAFRGGGADSPNPLQPPFDD